MLLINRAIRTTICNTNCEIRVDNCGDNCGIHNSSIPKRHGAKSRQSPYRHLPGPEKQEAQAVCLRLVAFFIHPSIFFIFVISYACKRF